MKGWANLSNVHDSSKRQKAADVARPHTCEHHRTVMVKLQYTPACLLKCLENEHGICKKQKSRSAATARRSCNIDRQVLAAVHSQISGPKSRDVLLADLTCCTQHSASSARACQCDRWRMDPGPAADGCQAQHTMLAAPRLALASSLDHMTPSCIAVNLFMP